MTPALASLANTRASLYGAHSVLRKWCGASSVGSSPAALRSLCIGIRALNVHTALKLRLVELLRPSNMQVQGHLNILEGSVKLFVQS